LRTLEDKDAVYDDSSLPNVESASSIATSGSSTSTGAATASASVGLVAASAAASLLGDCDADFVGDRRGLEPGIVVTTGALLGRVVEWQLNLAGGRQDWNKDGTER
jgi:hypothetical protein